MKRHEERRAAIEAVYQHDLIGRPLIDLVASKSLFIRGLALATDSFKQEIDAAIQTHATNRQLERIQPLVRATLRVALVEILHSDALPGDKPISAAGAIDQAVEYVKQYCEDGAAGFVNGVLHAIAFTKALDSTSPSQ